MNKLKKAAQKVTMPEELKKKILHEAEVIAHAESEGYEDSQVFTVEKARPNHITHIISAAADPKTVLTTTLTTGNDVMIKYDVEKDNIYFTIGKNFDKAVQKGDTNCDGIIDASDASIVLAGYASEQVGKTNYANPLISDINNDGKVDASDASFILKKYAELSTT